MVVGPELAAIVGLGQLPLVAECGRGEVRIMLVVPPIGIRAGHTGPVHSGIQKVTSLDLAGSCSQQGGQHQQQQAGHVGVLCYGRTEGDWWQQGQQPQQQRQLRDGNAIEADKRANAFVQRPGKCSCPDAGHL